MKKVVIGSNEAGGRLDKYLQHYMPAATKGFIYKMLRKKRIKLNGGKAAGNEILTEGDELTMYLSDETIEGFKEDKDVAIKAAPLNADEILYEDADILVMIKPVGELSQKASPNDISINERMLSYLENKGEYKKGDTFTPGICNRLDRNTGGIILAGKTLKGTQILSELIRERKIKKYYTAIVESDFCGIIEDGATDNDGWMHVNGYIKKDSFTNTVSVAEQNEKGYDPIETAFRVKEVKTDPNGKVCSVLEVDLITGKTHQIRAQLAFLGHPLVGDHKYGSKEKGPYFLRADRVIFPEDERLDPKVKGIEITI